MLTSEEVGGRRSWDCHWVRGFPWAGKYFQIRGYFGEMIKVHTHTALPPFSHQVQTRKALSIVFKQYKPSVRLRTENGRRRKFNSSRSWSHRLIHFFLFLFKIFCKSVCMWACVSFCAPNVCWCLWESKGVRHMEVTDRSVSHVVWMLGTELGSSARVVHALNGWAIFPAPESLLNFSF